MELLHQHIEALVFCSEQSLTLEEIAGALKLSYDWELSDEEIVQVLDQIKNKYSEETYAFELLEIAGGYQFFTKKQFHPTVSALIQHKAKKKLSLAQMEVLSVIAYKQPISKSEVEHIRGVNCDYAVQKLLEKNLVEIAGKSDAPGKPLLYVTSENFMDYFGIKSVKDLPQLKDIQPEENQIGTLSDSLEEPTGSLELPDEALSISSETVTDEETGSLNLPEAALEEDIHTTDFSNETDSDLPESNDDHNEPQA